jgi:hypothetical protein
MGPTYTLNMQLYEATAKKKKIEGRSGNDRIGVRR